jgi:hypothetical protein
MGEPRRRVPRGRSSASRQPVASPSLDTQSEGGSEVRRASPSTIPAGDAFREECPTLTDPVELEAARLKSALTTPPPAKEPITAPPAAVVRASPEEVQREVYAERFGGFERVPTVAVSADELAVLPLDGRAAMLLALLDGRSSIDALLQIGILNPLDTLVALEELIDRGIVQLR